METSKILVKTDRNGTKYWSITETCPRCGGRGDYILGTTNYGTCFCCHGTGKHSYSYKEYTPEHEAKLEARRQAKAAKKSVKAAEHAEDHDNEILERRYAEFGCGKDGIGYALTGKTFPVKDEIKENGGKWIYGAWVCPVEIKGKGIESRRIDLNGHIGKGSEMWLDDFDMYEAIHG